MDAATRSPTKPWMRRWFGDRSERAAGKYLKRLGHRILTRNYVSPLGEIDLITRDGDTVVFVEVRSTESGDIDRPAQSVDYNKQRRLTQLALGFLHRHRLLGHAARFDVVAVQWPADRRYPVVNHFPNAFEPVGRYQMFR